MKLIPNGLSTQHRSSLTDTPCNL